MKRIRKELQNRNSFNPFNKEFDIEKLMCYIEQVDVMSDDDKYAKTIAVVAEKYNVYYKKCTELINNVAKAGCISTSKIIEIAFSMANYDYINLSRQALEKGRNGNLFDFAHLEIINGESSFGNINIVGAVEGQVDYLNTLINIIRHIEFDERTDVEFDQMQAVRSIYAIANVLYYIKESYDVALWEDGYIIKDEGGIHVKYVNAEYPLAKHIGYIRSENNMAGAIHAVKNLSAWDEFRKVYFLKGRNRYVIDNVEIDKEGYVHYFLIERENNFDDDLAYALARTEVDLYYPYIYREEIEMLNGLSVNDMLILFSQLSKLIQGIERTLSNQVQNLLLVPVKLTKRELIRFLKQMTTYSKKQIEIFLDINTNMIDLKCRVDLRKKPLLFIDNEYICLMSAISAPNYSYLTDVWLEAAEVDLSQRGKAFERHIKSSLEELLAEKGYIHRIAQANKFTNRKGNYEEIDLLLSLKSIVVLAEIKCIKYAMECRDTHNNMKIMRKASEQIRRKADFIEQYKTEFVNEIGCIEGKTIIKVIITNYPIFAGTKVGDIPIVDFYLFDSYFRSGKLTTALYDGFDEVIEAGVPYYTNEDEMCDKLQEFVDTPPSIEVMRRKLGMQERQLSFPKSEVSISQEFPFVKAD